MPLLNEYLAMEVQRRERSMGKLEDLKEQYKKLEDRIKSLERDLKSPLSKEADEDALDTKNRDVLYGLYQIEKKNLARLEADISKLKQ